MDTNFVLSLPSSDEDQRIIVEQGDKVVSFFKLGEQKTSMSLNGRSVNIPETYSV